MIIANPIYDTVFKRLMEDKRIAKFFIETLTSEEIVELEVKPQEFTYNDNIAGLLVYRYDFIAKIKTADNSYKNVLIEIQKARNSIDLMRFRNYLAEQYKKEDEINEKSETYKIPLPIITIYLLGFKLNGIETSALKVERNYFDLINSVIIDKKNDFIENLTHDCYIVQIPRIQPRLKSKLDKLLSVFEQSNFNDDKEITKNYLYNVDNDIIKNMIDILYYVGGNHEERLQVEREQEAIRVYEVGMGPLRKKIMEKMIIIEEKEKTIEEKEKTIEEKEKTIEEKERKIEELDKKMEEKDRKMEEKDKKMAEQDKIIEELRQKLMGY